MLFLYDGKLNQLDLAIAKEIDANPYIILENNIFVAAEILGISASKLTKYCQKIKLKGFKEIKFKIKQELAEIEYLEQNTNNIDIKSIINYDYHNRIVDLENLLFGCNKLIIVYDSQNTSLAKFIASELRSCLWVDVISYSYNQEFSFEYAKSKPLTMFVDQSGKINLRSAMWYRTGNEYIHLTDELLIPTQNYYPIALAESKLNYSYQIKVVMIVSWIKQIKKHVTN